MRQPFAPGTGFGWVSERELREADRFFAELTGQPLDPRPAGRRPPPRTRAGPAAEFTEQAGGTPTLATHLHIARSCTGGTVWAPAAAPSAMSPATMNPGFISTADQLQFDAPLDASLVDLITNGAEYKKLVASGSPSRTDRLRVAVADLTGKKLCNPGYAGWGSTVRMMGTSSAKIAILYAAHQLIFDLDQLARSKGLTTEAALRTEAALAWSAFACPPDHHWLAAVDGSASPVGVAMSPALQRHLEEMVDARFSSISTGRATDLVLRVGFEYIASVLWQSGLRHPTRGGLWFPNTYQSGASTVATQRLCHRGNNPVKWKSDPLRETGIAITALSAVTFMTLLAQLRLADQSHSRAMESLLSRGCVWADVPVGARIRATKCGIAAGFQHGVLLVQDDKVRYALAYLTKDASWRESTHERFMRDIHQLVRANNP